MLDDYTKEKLKARLPEYLTSKGINIKKHFKCFNPDHTDNHPSMSYDKKSNLVHCFSCNTSYDLFDLIGLDYNLTRYPEKVSKACEMYGIAYNPSSNGNGKKPLTSSSKTAQKQDIEEAIMIEQYLEEAHSKLNTSEAIEYLNSRGISLDTAERFKLGYDKCHSKHQIQGIIIPTGLDSYVIRNIDTQAEKVDRYRKVGNSRPINLEALKECNRVFITEGELDCLSIIEAGAEAIGLGSTSNAVKLIEYIKEHKEEIITEYLFLAFDNDTGGKESTQKLLEELKEFEHIKAYDVSSEILSDYKDCNEALTQDRAGFIERIAQATQKPEQAIAEYIIKYSATSYLSYIEDRDNITPYQRTGFKTLDEILGGGFYAGLYILGAISSLGKTTFITQIADQIAEQEQQDVLIFSLEQSRQELITKSISRLTLRLKGSRDKACSYRDIVIARHKLTKEKEDSLQEAIAHYKTVSENIFIIEGIGNITADKVREAVERHILIRGKYPLVIIDYIQILAPVGNYGTDKQNMDKTVLELKRISRDKGIPVIGISSFNRMSYKDSVSMEAFKESGAIEYSSDVLIGLQLSGACQTLDINTAKAKYPRDVELVVLKNRNGIAYAKIGYKYYPDCNYFIESNNS